MGRIKKINGINDINVIHTWITYKINGINDINGTPTYFPMGSPVRYTLNFVNSINFLSNDNNNIYNLYNKMENNQ